MANCRHCSKKVEDGSSAHAACIKLHEEGWSDAQITAMVEGRANPEVQPVPIAATAPLYYYSLAKPLSQGQVIIAVMLGNLFFSLIAWFLYFITH